MARFDSGFQRSAHKVEGGIRLLLLLIVLGAIISYLGKVFAAVNISLPVNPNQFYSDLLLVVELASIISTISIIIKMPHWGTLYLLGWSVGFLFFWYLGLVNFSDVLIYIIPSTSILIIRLLHKTANANGRLEGYPTG